MRNLPNRAQVTTIKQNIIHTGRWGNAVISSFKWAGHTYILKDFSHCPGLFRWTFAPLLVRREIKALTRLDGLDGVPQQAFLVDELALAYLFINGKRLPEADSKLVNYNFFLQLESLVKRIHAHQVVHLDLRRGSNILCRDDGTPAIIDFQSSIMIDNLPANVKRLLQSIDLSGVYKNWLRFDPSSLDSQRRKFLSEINNIRRFWFLKGYPFG